MADTATAGLHNDAVDRTLLSWQRTAMASLAAAALVVRAGIVQRRLGLAIPAAALLVLGAAAEWLLSLRMYARSAQVAPNRADLIQPAALTVQAVIAIAAGASLALALGS
jgi:uncharacterized membrane protein YidH (DUF202 family)